MNEYERDYYFIDREDYLKDEIGLGVRRQFVITMMRNSDGFAENES